MTDRDERNRRYVQGDLVAKPAVSLTVASLFDGIGGFCIAFERAGAEAVATVEIDTAAAAISLRHFPHATQFHDVIKVTADDLRAAGFVPDRGILTAGWPCQDFSVAGRRAGLDGPRSGLWWEVVRILAELRPRWFLGENVPGLLSSVYYPECAGGCMERHGGAMGAVLGSLAELGYGVAYRVLDAQHFGVPQQRRRVFIVGHLGEPFGAAAQVLFEPESSERDSTESREARPGVAMPAADGVRAVSPTVTAKLAKGTGGPAGDEHQNLVVSTDTRAGRHLIGGVVAALTSNGVGTCGPDDNQAQAGHLIAAAYVPEVSPTLVGGSAGDGGSSRQSLVCITGRVTHTLTSEGADASEDGTGRGTPIVTAPALASTPAIERNIPGVATETVVRRLTELECERLQGYPDGWTERFLKSSPASGSARYRQLGNSVAVPVVEWIARRLMAQDAVLDDRP